MRYFQFASAAAILALGMGIRAEETAPPQKSDADARALTSKPPKKNFDGRKLIDTTVTASAINSEQASPGMVLTADGKGSATWTGGGGTGTLMTNIVGNVTGNVSGSASTITGILPILNGGTGSATQNFVDLTTNQSIAGKKTFTAGIIGALTGNVSGSATSFTGPLAGDVTGTQGATVVQTVGGVPFATIAAAANAMGAATSANVPGTLVMRDAIDGGFAGGTIVANAIGIGTNSPAVALEVTAAGESDIFCSSYGSGGSGFPVFVGRSARGTAAAPTAVKSGDPITLFGGRGFGATAFSPSSRVAMSFFASEDWTDSANGSGINFGTTPNGSATRVERMRIDQNGNVGIGTSAPASLLELSLNGSPELINTSYGSSLANCAFIGRKARGTSAAPTATGSGDTLALFGGRGYGASAFTSGSRAGMQLLASENWTNTANGSIMSFFNTPNGSTAPTERIRIDQNGNVGIGSSLPNATLTVATSAASTPRDCALSLLANGGNEWQLRSVSGFSGTGPAGSLQLYNTTQVPNFAAMTFLTNGNIGILQTNPGDTLEVNGAIRGQAFRCRQGSFGTLGTNSFNLNWTGSAMQLWVDTTNVGTIALTSDRRLKEHIAPMNNQALARVLSLKPVSFRYKTIADSVFTGSADTIEGFIADELQEVIPSAVNGKKDGLTRDGKIQPQTLNITPLVSVLTKAVQELKSEKDAEIARLNGRIAELEAKDKARDARLARLENALDAEPARAVPASFEAK